MAQVTVTLGAPSLNGKDCVEQVEKAFGSQSFPLAAEIENLMPRWCSFPHGNGFNIGHVAAVGMNKASISFESLEDLKDFAYTIGVVSDMNRFETAVSIKAEGTEEEGDEDPEETQAQVDQAIVGESTVAASTKSSAAKKRIASKKE